MIGRIFKWVFCAALSVMVAFLILVTGIVALLDLDEAKVTQLARFFATMRFIESEYVDEVEPAKLIEAVRCAVERQQGMDRLRPEAVPGLLNPDLPQQAITSAFRKYRK